jgi:methylase of polypeptide subunit release factors
MWLCFPRYTLGVDLDPDALHVARNNLASLDISDSTIDFIQADLSSPSSFRNLFGRHSRNDSEEEPFFDTVVSGWLDWFYFLFFKIDFLYTEKKTYVM